MQRGPVLLDRPDLREIDRIILDGPRFGGGELTTFLAPHGREGGQDDLVRALAPGVTTMSNVITLSTPVMTSREAARHLRIPAATLAHWLDGETRGDIRYGPILRAEPIGANTITWGEMVEARYLRAYRRDLRVSMQSLRPFVAALRAELGRRAG